MSEPLFKKQKRAAVNDALRKEICQYSKNYYGTKHDDIVAYFNNKYSELHISRPTVSKIIKEHTKWLNIEIDEISERSIRHKSVKFLLLDQALKLEIQESETSIAMDIFNNLPSNAQQLVKNLEDYTVAVDELLATENILDDNDIVNMVLADAQIETNKKELEKFPPAIITITEAYEPLKKALKDALYNSVGSTFSQKKKISVGNIKHFGDKKEISLTKPDVNDDMYSNMDSKFNDNKLGGAAMGLNSSFFFSLITITPKVKRVSINLIGGFFVGTIDFEIDEDMVYLSSSLNISLNKRWINPKVVKTHIKMSIKKFFTLDINLSAVEKKLAIAKTQFVREIFSVVNGFGGTTLLFILLIRTIAHDLGTFLEGAGKKTCIINRFIETGNRICCAVIGFDFDENLEFVFYTELIFNRVKLFWARINLVYCEKYGHFGHLAFKCGILGVSVLSLSKKSYQKVASKKFCFWLTKLYKKKSVPISHFVAFGDKSWAQVVSLTGFSGSTYFSFNLGFSFSGVLSLDNILFSISQFRIGASGSLFFSYVLNTLIAANLDLSSIIILDGPMSVLLLPFFIVSDVSVLGPSSSKVLFIKISCLKSKLVALEAFVGLIMAKLDHDLVWKIAICNVCDINVPTKQKDIVHWHMESMAESEEIGTNYLGFAKFLFQHYHTHLGLTNNSWPTKSAFNCYVNERIVYYLGGQEDPEFVFNNFFSELLQSTTLPQNYLFAPLITEINREIEKYTKQKFSITFADKGKGRLQTPAGTPKQIQLLTWKKQRFDSPANPSYYYTLRSTINIINTATTSTTTSLNRILFQNFGTISSWEITDSKEEESKYSEIKTLVNQTLENQNNQNPNVINQYLPPVIVINSPPALPNAQQQQQPQLLSQQQIQQQSQPNLDPMAYTPIAKLEKFTGKEDNAQVWLNNNTANLWYQSLINKPQDFNAFKIEFLKYFNNNNSINKLANTFTTIKQGENKSILNQFIYGLCSSILQCVCLLHPINLQAAITNAQDFEAVELEANHAQAINLVMNGLSELDSKLKQFSDSINQKLEGYYS
ncbi:hypothetical protein G9A89_014144 [Geosiphon pyriformis]|nr:hypothetical protein G9A89_014144 [Geosiphon pyriformis]